MLVRKRIGIVFVALIAILVTSLAKDQALAAGCSARFSCGFGPHPSCFFVVRSYGRDKYFRVDAGRFQMIYGLEPTARFCESDNGYPNGNSCRQRVVRMACR